MVSKMFLISFCILSRIIFAIQIDKDSVNFADSTNYIILTNNNSIAITIDSIKVIYVPSSTFYGDQFMIDTGNFKGKKGSMYGDFSYTLAVRKNNIATAFPAYSNKIAINSKSFLLINNILLGDCWECLSTSSYYSPLIDTVKLIFKSSDNSQDSLKALVTLLYGSSTINRPNNSKIIIKDKSIGKYLLNGKIVNSKSLTAKIIKCISK